MAQTDRVSSHAGFSFQRGNGATLGAQVALPLRLASVRVSRPPLSTANQDCSRTVPFVCTTSPRMIPRGCEGARCRTCASLARSEARSVAFRHGPSQGPRQLLAGPPDPVVGGPSREGPWEAPGARFPRPPSQRSALARERSQGPPSEASRPSSRAPFQERPTGGLSLASPGAPHCSQARPDSSQGPPRGDTSERSPPSARPSAGRSGAPLAIGPPSVGRRLALPPHPSPRALPHASGPMVLTRPPKRVHPTAWSRGRGLGLRMGSGARSAREGGHACGAARLGGTRTTPETSRPTRPRSGGPREPRFDTSRGPGGAC